VDSIVAGKQATTNNNFVVSFNISCQLSH